MPPPVEISTTPPTLPEDGIGDRIRVLRENKGLTQADFAAKTKEHDPERRGISRTVLVGYESGKFKPGAREIRAICDAFDVPPHWLLYGSELKGAASSPTPVNAADVPDMVGVFTVALSLTNLKPHERQSIQSLVHALSSARKGRTAQEALETLAWHMAADAEERLHLLSGSDESLNQVATTRGHDLVEKLTKLYEAAHAANYATDRKRREKK